MSGYYSPLCRQSKGSANGTAKEGIELKAFPFMMPRTGRSQLPGYLMLIHLLKSKIHRARVTAANVNYEGSLSIVTLDPTSTCS